jgi:Domain of unknown function (DUF5979)
MRRGGRALVGLVVLVSGPVASAITATPASAGKTPLLTVTKVVNGTAPPGAQYVVDITCDGGATASPNQMIFSGPGSDDAAINSGSTTCTVTESQSAGAAVSYACEITGDPGGNSACSGGHAVVIAGGGVQATITVTNTYAPPAGPEPPPAAPPAEAVATAPLFTG